MQKLTGIVPRALRDRPVLTSRQNHLYGTYCEISKSRPPSPVGVLPLSVGVLKDHADYWKIERLDEREELFLFMGAMDEVYCEIANKRDEPTKAGK